jgi:hypothetical protein
VDPFRSLCAVWGVEKLISFSAFPTVLENIRDSTIDEDGRLYDYSQSVVNPPLIRLSELSSAAFSIDNTEDNKNQCMIQANSLTKYNSPR